MHDELEDGEIPKGLIPNLEKWENDGPKNLKIASTPHHIKENLFYQTYMNAPTPDPYDCETTCLAAIRAYETLTDLERFEEALRENAKLGFIHPAEVRELERKESSAIVRFDKRCAETVGIPGKLFLGELDKWQRPEFKEHREERLEMIKRKYEGKRKHREQRKET